MLYVHVLIPLNISTIYQQAEIYTDYLVTVANSTTSEYSRIPFTRAARDTGAYGIRKINRLTNKLKNLDLNLPHPESRMKRETEFNRTKRLTQWEYFKCMFVGDQTYQGLCDLVPTVSDHLMPLAPFTGLASIRKLAKGPKYEDTPQYQIDENLTNKLYLDRVQKKIDNILYPPKPDIPEVFWSAYQSTPAPEQFTTFRPQSSVLDKDEQAYLKVKAQALKKNLKQLELLEKQ